MEIFLTFSEGFGLFEVHFLIKNFLINKKTRIKLASDLAFLNHSQESLRLNKSGYYQCGNTQFDLDFRFVLKLSGSVSDQYYWLL